MRCSKICGCNVLKTTLCLFASKTSAYPVPYRSIRYSVARVAYINGRTKPTNDAKKQVKNAAQKGAAHSPTNSKIVHNEAIKIGKDYYPSVERAIHSLHTRLLTNETLPSATM